MINLPIFVFNADIIADINVVKILTFVSMFYVVVLFLCCANFKKFRKACLFNAVVWSVKLSYRCI